MAKYVYDFNQINTIASKLISSAADLTKSTNKFVSDVETELATWTGDAKNFFDEQTRIQAKYSLLKAHSYNCLGEYLKAHVQKIDNLEQSLSNNKI